MDYDYYKTKYKTYSIKLDYDRDRDVINFLDEMKRAGLGPKSVILAAIRTVCSMMVEFNEGGPKQ